MARDLLEFFIGLQENEYSTPLSVEFGGELDIIVKYPDKDPIKYSNMYYHTYQVFTNQSFLEFRSMSGSSLKIYFDLMSPCDGEGVYGFSHNIDEILFERALSPRFKNALSDDDEVIHCDDTI